MDWVFQTILLFTVYSMIGWACESIYCSIPAKKFINRGFLNGPFCPVYGFGALLVIICLRPIQNHVVALFFCGMLLTSLLEYITGYLLEKAFHTKWWDYSQKKFNLRGRVCLKNSLMFGALCVILMRIINPYVERLVGRIPSWLLTVLALALFMYFIIDSVITVRSILQLNGKLAVLQEALDELKTKNEMFKSKLKKGLEQKLEEKISEDAREKLEVLSKRLQEMEQVHKRMQKRLLHAFPNMTSIRHNESLNRLKANLEKRKVDKH
jgi:uncharacterized membrane protein